MYGSQRTTATMVVTSILVGGAVLTAAGCGSNGDYQNKPRPPKLFVVTAAIARDHVSVSPKRFGAGPISLIVTNQTNATQQVTLQPSGGTATATQQTGPINPQDTATLQTDVAEGVYDVKVESNDIKPARVTVGRERPSAQNDLLLP
jgi:hypothetical protein